MSNRLEASKFSKVRRAGFLLRYFAGSETLDETSFSVTIGGAFAPALLTWIGNAGFRLHMWTGSAKYWRENDGKRTDYHFDPDVGVSTAIGGVSYSRTTKLAGSARFPWFGASVGSKRFHGVSLGLTHVISLGVGEIERRGPYVFGAMGIPFGFVRASLGVGFFYPPFEVMTKYTRPLAERIRAWQDRTRFSTQQLAASFPADILFRHYIAISRAFL